MSEPNVKVAGESTDKKEKHAALYKTPKSVKIESIRSMTSNGNEKEKFIRVKTYANGVVKREICGLKKNGKFIFGTDK